MTTTYAHQIRPAVTTTVIPAVARAGARRRSGVSFGNGPVQV